jgi:hypothetical protein
MSLNTHNLGDEVASLPVPMLLENTDTLPEPTTPQNGILTVSLVALKHNEEAISTSLHNQQQDARLNQIPRA